MPAQRIYIGGLTPDIKLDDVIGRFKPFGEVHACEIVRGKSFISDPSHCRGFAYVSFTPKDAAALSRVFSLYNGCKWRGQKLRVELAKPDYLTKLQKEWQEEQQQEEKQDDGTKDEQQQHQHTAPAADADEAEAEHNKTTIRITMPGKRKSIVVDLTAKAKSYRAWFPAHKEKRVADLSWEALPPSKRVALQAVAEAAAPRPAAAAAGVSDQEQQQQQHAVEHAKGVSVPYQYKEQHQQQQQQPAKGMKAQVDAEHWSQLKLLKRIAEQEKAAALQQQQFEQAQQRSAAAADVQASKPVVAPGKHLTKQQQQQVSDIPAGVVVMSDVEDEDVVADGVNGATLAQQLSKFDDSDSEDPAAGAGAGGQDLLTPGRPQQSNQAAAVGHAFQVNLNQQASAGRRMQRQRQRQQQQQQHEEEEEGEGAASVEEISNGSSGGGPELHLAAAAASTAEQGLPGQAHDTDSTQQGTTGSTSSDQGAEGSEDLEPGHEAQQPLAATAAQPQPKALRPQQQQQQQQCRHQPALTALAAEEGGARTATGCFGEAGEEGDSSDSMEVDSEGEQQQQQMLRSAAGKGIKGQPLTTPRGQPRQQQQQHVLQPQKLQQQMPVQPLPVVSFVDPLEAQVESAVAAALDRFGSDSEEVLVDIEDEDTDTVTVASSKPKAGRVKPHGRKTRPAVGISISSKGREDELLCPVAPRRGTGRAAVFGSTGTQQRRQQQGAQSGSPSTVQQKLQQRTPRAAGENKRYSS